MKTEDKPASEPDVTRYDPEHTEPIRCSTEQETPSESGSPSCACPHCGGPLIEIRGHLECRKCHRVTEGCCEGGRT
jgi:hypothetical protein